MFVRKFGITSALAATVLAAGTLAAPVASAEPIQRTDFTPLIGIGTVGTGSSATPDRPVLSVVGVSTDAQEPGISRFRGELLGDCVVNWRNLDTGASGTAPACGPFIFGGGDPYFAVTGPGTVTATSVVGNGITLLPGSAMWEVP